MAPADVVRAWMEAVNAVDVDALLKLADPGIRLVTPRDGRLVEFAAHEGDLPA